MKTVAKTTAIICEFNPFHNGHRYLLEQARQQSGADRIFCLMSGAFTQRGDMAIMDKYDRARHAVLGGADIVAELPVCYAISPAEVFARGSVSVLSGFKDISCLAFGCESGTKEDFIAGATILASEPEEFTGALKAGLDAGKSYIESCQKAFEACGGKKDLLSSPNNILGLEYTKAILKSGADIDILPIPRVGAEHNDVRLHENISSASAIRTSPLSDAARSCVPDFVAKDLKDTAAAEDSYEHYLMSELFHAPEEFLATICGCTEGLENRLKKYEQLPFAEFISTANTKRYSSSRIKRILLANMLHVTADDIRMRQRIWPQVNLLAVEKKQASVISRDEEFMSRISTPSPYWVEINSQYIWQFLNNQPRRQQKMAVVERK